MSTITAAFAPVDLDTAANLVAAGAGPCPPTPVFDDPGQEGFGLLGPAWRSSRPTRIPTGHTFDVVQVPAHHAAPVLRQLQRLGVRQGAVFADGDVWHFFVPPGSDYVPAQLGGPGWPPPTSYVSGELITIPPRGARTDDEPLRWVTRLPAGRLFTAPVWLFAGLSALRQQPAPAVNEPSLMS